ncbi:hypothetical protein C1H46_038711 [Malus baccata]|uniref:Uncharacterized protein n=1 Tax=Malus baccata TaxID=106549 RepID=A0A540KND3_MALBA|nr:hypothetical protein C1H46_038711 [Malus baccata]
MRPITPSIRNLYRSAYRSIVKKWRHEKKKSSSPPEEEAKVDQFRDNDVIFEEVDEDTRQVQKKTMHGFHSFRCISLQRLRRHGPSSPRGLKSVDTCMDCTALDALACKDCDAMVHQALEVSKAWTASLTCLLLVSQRAQAERVAPLHPPSRKLRAGKAGPILWRPLWRPLPRQGVPLKALTARPPIPFSQKVKAGRAPPPSCFLTHLGC